jgi:hypothetical protein
MRTISLLVAGLILTTACVASTCFANPVYLQDGTGNYVRLSATPCALSEELFDKVQVSMERRTGLLRAQVYFNGQLLEACYEERRGLIRVLDEDGDNSGPFPVVDFVEEDGGPTTYFWRGE